MRRTARPTESPGASPLFDPNARQVLERAESVVSENSIRTSGHALVLVHWDEDGRRTASPG